MAPMGITRWVSLTLLVTSIVAVAASGVDDLVKKAEKEVLENVLENVLQRRNYRPECYWEVSYTSACCNYVQTVRRYCRNQNDRCYCQGEAVFQQHCSQNNCPGQDNYKKEEQQVLKEVLEKILRRGNDYAAPTPKPYNPPYVATTPEPDEPPYVATTPEPYNPPYVAPTPKPYNPPYVAPTPEPYNPPYVAPTPEPYNPPYVAPTPEPYNPPYVAPTPEPYNPPYVAPTPEPYNPPYVAPTPEPYKPVYPPPNTGCFWEETYRSACCNNERRIRRICKNQNDKCYCEGLGVYVEKCYENNCFGLDNTKNYKKAEEEVLTELLKKALLV